MTKKKSFTETLVNNSEKALSNYIKSRTPKARAKLAREKLAFLESKEKAELLERKLKEKEAEYKKQHPSRFKVLINKLVD